MIMQIMINFSPNLDMAYKTIQSVSVPNSNLFGSMKTQKEKNMENFLLCYMGKWAGGHSFAPNMAATTCVEIILTLNSLFIGISTSNWQRHFKTG